jgi:hypothetical protein
VPDLRAAAAFYELLGLQQVNRGPMSALGRREEAANEESQDDGGGKERFAETPSGGEVQETVSFGTEARAPIVNLTPGAAASAMAHGASLEDSLVVRCGVVALRFQSSSIEPIRRRLWSAAGQRIGARVLSLGRGILEPLGAVESMMVRGPGGVLHQFLGRL